MRPQDPVPNKDHGPYEDPGPCWTQDPGRKNFREPWVLQPEILCGLRNNESMNCLKILLFVDFEHVSEQLLYYQN